MVSFENANIPQYLASKISLNIVDKEICNKMVCCKNVHGITNKVAIQNVINSYNKINKIVYIFLISDTVDVFNILIMFVYIEQVYINQNKIKMNFYYRTYGKICNLFLCYQNLKNQLLDSVD